MRHTLRGQHNAIDVAGGNRRCQKHVYRRQLLTLSWSLHVTVSTELSDIIRWLISRVHRLPYRALENPFHTHSARPQLGYRRLGEGMNRNLCPGIVDQRLVAARRPPSLSPRVAMGVPGVFFDIFLKADLAADFLDSDLIRPSRHQLANASEGGSSCAVFVWMVRDWRFSFRIIGWQVGIVVAWQIRVRTIRIPRIPHRVRSARFARRIRVGWRGGAHNSPHLTARW